MINMMGMTTEPERRVNKTGVRFMTTESDDGSKSELSH